MTVTLLKHSMLKTAEIPMALFDAVNVVIVVPYTLVQPEIPGIEAREGSSLLGVDCEVSHDRSCKAAKASRTLDTIR